MEFCTLFSGSSGNSTYIHIGGHEILVDTGKPMKDIATALASIDKNIENISKIFITHEHTDHIVSLGAIIRKYKINTYLSNGTYDAISHKLGEVDKNLIHTFSYGDDLQFDNLLVEPIPIPHDAAMPVCYKFKSGDESCLVATDIGHITDEMEEKIYGALVALIESNHDVHMLETGDYPIFLQQRILGKKGHLSNKTASDLAVKLINSGTKHLVLGHISKNNNTPDLAEEYIYKV
ncbi:MBL fold metallo-hydrolase, partial [Treponema sp. R6D11]